MPRFGVADGVATSFRDPTALNHSFRTVSPYNAAAALSKRKCSSCGVWGHVGRQCSLCGEDIPSAVPTPRGSVTRVPFEKIDANRTASKVVATAAQQLQASTARQQNPSSVVTSRESSLVADRVSESDKQQYGSAGFTDWIRLMQTRERQGDVREALLRKATAPSGSDSFVMGEAQTPINEGANRVAADASSTRAYYGRSTTPAQRNQQSPAATITKVASARTPTAQSSRRQNAAAHVPASMTIQPSQQKVQPRSRSPWYARVSQQSAMPLHVDSRSSSSRSASHQHHNTHSHEEEAHYQQQQQQQHPPHVHEMRQAQTRSDVFANAEQQQSFRSYLQLAAARSASATSANHLSERSGSTGSSSSQTLTQCRTCSAKLPRGHTCRVCMCIDRPSTVSYAYH